MEIMKKLLFNHELETFVLLVSILGMCSCSALGIEYTVNSPDGRIFAYFGISDEQKPYYRIAFSGTNILQQSKLGIIREDGDFSKNLTVDSVSGIERIKTDYNMIHGKRRHSSYLANRRVFHLVNTSGGKMDVIFQVSNDGLAFRYYFPEKSDELKKIKEEVSSFNFLAGTKAWIQHMAVAKTGWCQTQPSYEEHYQQGVETSKLALREAGWVFPALFNFDKYWFLITETAVDRNYCGSRLKRNSVGDEFFVGFPQEPEVYPGGVLNPQSTLPWYTPWRIIAIGDTLKTIVESTLGTDLAIPPKMKDTSFIKPGRASWSWVLLKDDSVVYDVQKRFIDFAADMSWEYCLVDVNWDTQIGYDKIKELADYAKTKNVGLILWYNSAGDWNSTPYHPKHKMLTHESRVKEFTRLKEMGIKGVKVDFFGGDGQSVMVYYQDIFTDAAEFGLMVNCHGTTLPRGWQRTYPNVVTMESVKGFEFVTFEQVNADLEPTHSCMQPFTRNVFDPMDFTPVCFSEIPRLRRVTTNGFELALSVIFFSGVQHFAEKPEGMAGVPGYVKNFMEEVPVVWDDICFIDGCPGKLVVLARKFEDAWYVAGINGENKEKDISFELPFLDDAKTGLLITDGANNRSFTMERITVAPRESLKMKMMKNGGFVIKFDD